ncbi:MAG TPA: trehalase family glycosidase, partial [Flavisolibacter sp.]
MKIKATIMRSLYCFSLAFFCSCITARTQFNADPNNHTSKELSALNSRLCKGWNTWNIKSVLSHVLLPQGFALNLQLVNHRSGEILKEALVGRENYDTKEHVIAGPHAYDGSYTELVVEWQGLRVEVQTATRNHQLYLLANPIGSLPGDSLLVYPRMLWGRQGEISVNEAIISANTTSGEITVKVVGGARTSTTENLRFSLARPIILSTDAEASAGAVEKIIIEAKTKFSAEKNKYKDLSEVYNAMQTVLAWTTIYDPDNNRVINPVSRTFSNDWVLFDWDTYFAAYMLSLDNKDLAYANAIAITKEITKKGFIPNNSQYGNKSEDRSEPQVGSIVVREIYRRYKEKWFLREVYNELLSWNRWRAANRDIDGYLVYGTDPYDYGDNKSRSATQSGKMKAAKWESGMDNSPMWDDAVFDSTTHRMLLADVGLMSLYIADCRSLSEIATILGKKDDSKELTDRAVKYAKKLQTLWDDRVGLYLNKDLTTGKFSYRLSPTLFYPLLAKVPDQQQAFRMIKDHFYNPNEFWGEYIMPSIARNDSAYKDNHYWRGRIWAPLNFLVYLGMRNYSLPAAQKDMVEKSKNLLLKTWIAEHHVCENYHADNGRGGEADTWSDAFYHWGALL